VLLLLACAGPEPEPIGLIAMTWNTGLGAASGDVGDIADGWYGNGLAWLPAVEAAREVLAEAAPDIVAFQEIFDPAECAEIPEEFHTDFVCAEWSEGDPTVAEDVLGPDYSLSCHPGNSDKCIGVRNDISTLDDAEGFGVEGCGSGARVARLHLADLTVVSVHGSSGLDSESESCRVAQVDQVFVDLGDGSPGADGASNLVLGDLNTDPGRFTDSDPSAERWNDFVGEGLAFGWHTEVGPDAPGSYAGLADIDHVASDGLTGGCEVLEKPDEVFDHRPILCPLTAP